MKHRDLTKEETEHLVELGLWAENYGIGAIEKSLTCLIEHLDSGIVNLYLEHALNHLPKPKDKK